MSKVPEKETPTAPRPNEIAYPSTALVTTAPPVAGYSVQQIQLQGVPVVQNRPYPATYPPNYQQQYHSTQLDQIVISSTSQTTPLMVDANGIALEEIQHSLQQQRQAQQQRRRRVSSISSVSTLDSEGCCDVCCCCFEVCNDCCCCCCSSGFNCLCKIIGKIFTILAVLFVIALVWNFLN